MEDGHFLKHVHADDRVNFEAHVHGLSPANPSYALTFRFVRADGHQIWLEETAKGEFDDTGSLLRINGLTRDITAQKELEDHKNTLISELDHRVKNVLALVLTVASRTRETSSSMTEFVAALDSRIKSMASTQELLSHRRWQGIGAPNVVPPKRSGFGTSVVRELVPYELGGSADLAHLPEGVSCKLEIPARWLSTNIP